MAGKIKIISNNSMPITLKPLRIVIAIIGFILLATLTIWIFVSLVTTTSELTGLQFFQEENCTDSDNGIIQTEFGSCIDKSRQKHYDSCVVTGLKEEFKLQEWYCNNNTNICVSKIVSCQPGFVCTGGRCVKT